jgi:hypothetical protein
MVKEEGSKWPGCGGQCGLRAGAGFGGFQRATEAKKPGGGGDSCRAGGLTQPRAE